MRTIMMQSVKKKHRRYPPIGRYVLVVGNLFSYDNLNYLGGKEKGEGRAHIPVTSRYHDKTLERTVIET